MVEVGDKVFVTPVNGQKDYIAVITGPIGVTGAAGGGVVEGDYNTWTIKWIKRPTCGTTSASIDALIDEKNNVINIAFRDTTSHWRFGVYNLSDFSTVFQSSSINYTYKPPDSDYKRGFHHNMVSFIDGGLSRSLQTYLLLMRADRDTIEVWRGGSAVLWSRSVAIDFTRSSWLYNGCISLTGKYILIVTQDGSSPYYTYLMLYEGFDSGTSTSVTETRITDSSKAWAANDLIGHIVYITSGGANEEQATITSNTGIIITCSAATFVTWGMSVGDTYKID